MIKIEKYWKKWRHHNSDASRKILLNEIWQIYYPKLCVYIINSFCMDQDTVCDNARDILIKVFEKIGTYNPEYRFSTWIYTIARNHMADIFRKISAEKIEFVVSESMEKVSDDRIDIENDYIIQENCIRLKTEIENLPAKDREIIYLRYYEKLKYSDISEVTGIPSGTVKNRLFLIKKKLEGVLF